MADIFNLVNYETTVPVTIFKDKSGSVVFDVCSLENERAEKLQSLKRATSLGKRVKSGETDISPEALGEMLSDIIDPTPELLSTCVRSWNWNGHSFGDLGKDPEFTEENVIRALSIKWVRELVKSKASELGNFKKA